MPSSYNVVNGRPYINGVAYVTVTDAEAPAKKITGYRQGVVVVVGTAENAVPASYPLDTPVLITGTPAEVADIGDVGMLKIFADTAFTNGHRQTVAFVRVAEGVDDAATIDNIVGGVDVDNLPLGLEVLKSMASTTGVEPGIVIVPHFSTEAAVQAKLQTLLPIIHAIGFVDTVQGDASETADNLRTAATALNDKRLTMVYPNAKTDVDASAWTPGSIFAALAESKTAPHVSSSNTPLPDIVALSQPVDYQSDASTAMANQINEKGVATFVNYGGTYRLWGIRCTATDAADQNRHWVRINDKIRNGALDIMMQRHGANIDADFANYALARMQSLLLNMIDNKEITGGTAWLDGEVNTAKMWLQGKFTVDHDFGRYGSGEQVFIIGRVNDTYYDDIANQAVGA